MLTALELELLSYFLMHQDEPIAEPRCAKRSAVTRSAAPATVYVRRLQEKIEVDAANPVPIRGVWGVGYQFSPSEP